MDNYHLYLITNKVNDKKYVGITKLGYLTRWSRHIKLVEKGSNHLIVLYNAMRKYGIDAFDIEFLCEGESWDHLIELEKVSIILYNTFIGDEDSWGYNATRGGDGTDGYKFTDEQLARRKEKGLSDAHKQSISDNNAKYWLGKNHSKESIDKIREKRALQICSEETREKYRQRWAGKKNPRAKAVVIDDIYYDTLTEAAKYVGFSADTISKKIRNNAIPNYKWA